MNYNPKEYFTNQLKPFLPFISEFKEGLETEILGIQDDLKNYAKESTDSLKRFLEDMTKEEMEKLKNFSCPVKKAVKEYGPIVKNLAQGVVYERIYRILS